MAVDQRGINSLARHSHPSSRCSPLAEVTRLSPGVHGARSRSRSLWWLDARPNTGLDSLAQFFRAACSVFGDQRSHTNGTHNAAAPVDQVVVNGDARMRHVPGDRTASSDGRSRQTYKPKEMSQIVSG